MNLIKAAWVPGLPHLLQFERSKKWFALHTAMETLGKEIANLKPEALVLYSTQWLSVLGTSFQCDPNPKGIHVDENWYEWGDLPFNFKVDTALSKSFALALNEDGMPAKTIHYANFPIDTATIVAMKYLNPTGNIPVSIVSSWAYADANKSEQTGKLMRQTIEKSGKKTVAIACSSLSTRYFTEEINLETDKIRELADDQFNQKLLQSFEKGNWGEAQKLAQDFAKCNPTDMQLNAVHWLKGILSTSTASAKTLAYGPLWGTGAAVVSIQIEGTL